MNNIVILIILALFGLAILRVAWNTRIKYSYGYPDIEDAEQARELAALQRLDDREIAAVDHSMRKHAGPVNYGNRYTSAPTQKDRKRYKERLQKNIESMGTVSE